MQQLGREFFFRTVNCYRTRTAKKNVQVPRVARSRSRRGGRADKAQDLDETPITMDYQSEFARIKEERWRLKELERTLRAELEDVAKGCW